MKTIDHVVIVVPGLGDDIKMMELGVSHWRWHGMTPIVHRIGWRDGEAFEPKLKRLLSMIDGVAKEGWQVSLVGTSAGGSAVLNAFVQRKKAIHRVINVCGRLRIGKPTGLRSLERMAHGSPAFFQSVKRCETNEKKLSAQDRTKIMTMRPLLGDELVPAETSAVHGATNIVLPSGEHMLSIGLALTLFSGTLISFLRQE